MPKPNQSLEQYYHRAHKKIKVAEAVVEKPFVSQLIRSCRLKPLTVFSSIYNPAKLYEQVWVDEFGSYVLEIGEELEINLAPIKVEPHCTDIWRYEDPNFLANHSKFACAALFPETDKFVVLLCGTDNYFRCYSTVNKKLEIVSPLVLGLRPLQHCIKWMTNPSGPNYSKFKLDPRYADARWIFFHISKKQIHRTKGYPTLQEIIYGV